MKNFFEGYGFTIDGMLHLSPREANELCQKGAILLDLRLELLLKNKLFDVPECLYCHDNLHSRTLITRRRYPAVAHPYP